VLSVLGERTTVCFVADSVVISDAHARARPQPRRNVAELVDGPSCMHTEHDFCGAAPPTRPSHLVSPDDHHVVTDVGSFRTCATRGRSTRRAHSGLTNLRRAFAARTTPLTLCWPAFTMIGFRADVVGAPLGASADARFVAIAVFLLHRATRSPSTDTS